MNPLISAVVPVYNGESYIKDILKDLMNQSYTNIEIIIVNDGSTDSTDTILKRIAPTDNRITVIKQENKGLSGARNTGIKNASADYITFVDGDDRLERKFIEKLYHTLSETKSDMAVCRMEKVYGAYEEKESANGKVYTYDKREAVEHALKGKNIHMFATAKLYKTCLFDNVQFPEDVKFIEDAYVACKIILKCNKVAYCNEPLYKYIFRENSLMNSKFILDRELNIIRPHLYNKEIILKEFPDLELLTEQRITWAYIRFYDRLIFNYPLGHEVEREYRKKLKNRMKYVLVGNFFNIKRKISLLSLYFTPYLYKALLKRKSNKFF